MSQIPADAARGDVHQECVQELRRPYPDYAKVQGLAILSLVEIAQEVARQLAELSRQIALASRR